MHFTTAVENGRGKGFIFDLQCCTITLALTANKRKSKTSEKIPKKSPCACHFICFVLNRHYIRALQSVPPVCDIYAESLLCFFSASYTFLTYRLCLYRFHRLCSVRWHARVSGVSPHSVLCAMVAGAGAGRPGAPGVSVAETAQTG